MAVRRWKTLEDTLLGHLKQDADDRCQDEEADADIEKDLAVGLIGFIGHDRQNNIRGPPQQQCEDSKDEAAEQFPEESISQVKIEHGEDLVE